MQMAKKSPSSDSSALPKAPRARRAKGPVNGILPVDAAKDSAAGVALAWAPSDDDIRVRAYQLYLERGGSGGTDVDDWVRAEQELHKR